MKTPNKNPEIIMRDGKPVAVILDIDIYEQMLEQIKGIEDLEYLEKIRQQPLEFRSLDDFLKRESYR
jgi:PHD/YefM family antitoxin component YafN of YafNO toxin-antitoxin module